MFLELLSELLNEFSPMYFYLGILLSIIQFEHIQFDYQKHIYQNDVFIRKSHALQFQLLILPEAPSVTVQKRNWLAHKTKRIEAPDDDKEDSSFSIFNKKINRGGQKWRQLLYSQNLRYTACS